MVIDPSGLLSIHRHTGNDVSGYTSGLPLEERDADESATEAAKETEFHQTKLFHIICFVRISNVLYTLSQKAIE